MGDFLDEHIEEIIKNEPTIDEIIRKEMEKELEKDKHYFRIIAVRVLGACAPRIRRALKEETTYFLCNDYEDKYDETGKWQTIVKITEDGRLPMDFFAIPKQAKRFCSPSVSISAIVGKNGDGKSSLVEVMLRIINNFGVAFGFKEDQESLTSIEGLEAHKELVAMQPGDVPTTYADATALERDFGFTPKITLREGLRKFAEWYKEYYG